MGNNVLIERGLIYNWSSDWKLAWSDPVIHCDTLRDGTQDVDIRQPNRSERLRYVEMLAEVGVQEANIGFPVSSVPHLEDVVATAEHIRDNSIPLDIHVLARTQEPDIKAAIEVSQRAGVPVRAVTILGSSKVRQLVESWDKANMKKWITESIKLATSNGVTVNFLTEDGTRTHPEILKELYLHALDAGAERVTLADTVGAIDTFGTRKLVRYMREVIGNEIHLQWHGHNDRGLGVANALVAFEEGANGAHVSILGIGERAGNVNMAELLVNLVIGGFAEFDMKALFDLSSYSSKVFETQILPGAPVVGEHVYDTSVGMHAAAIVKARKMKETVLANNVYNGVDPGYVGKVPTIYVGPLSGKANVLAVCEDLGITPSEEIVDVLLNHVRDRNFIMKHEEVLSFLEEKNLVD